MRTLRRLFLAKNGDGHMCLIPAEDGAPKLPAFQEGFRCACGSVFNASIETLSWTTEYTPRCLSGFRKEPD